MKRIILSIVLLVACISSFAQIQLGGDSLIIDFGNPTEYVIGGVVVTGTKYLDEAVLISISGLQVGDTIEVPGDKTSKAVSNLWKQGLFSDIKLIASRTQGKLIFFELNLNERPRLSKFSFKGVSKSEADKIREKINLERDKVVTDNVMTTTSNTVRNFYVEKGFWDAGVTINEIKDTTFANREILEIVVDKKQKVRVRDIEFVGAKALTVRKTAAGYERYQGKKMV